jgi:hypothetical protein
MTPQHKKGQVALEAGRVIEGEDAIEFRAGRQAFVDYYETVTPRASRSSAAPWEQRKNTHRSALRRGT